MASRKHTFKANDGAIYRDIVSLKVRETEVREIIPEALVPLLHKAIAAHGNREYVIEAVSRVKRDSDLRKVLSNIIDHSSDMAESI